MTDKKISELTAASTPLAGTEVLPIVQSNSTKKVSVANLTDGRNVSVARLDAYNLSGTGLMSTFTSGWSNTRVAIEGDGPSGAGVLNITNAAATAPLPFKVKVNGTEVVDVSTTGNVKATTGNFVVGTAGKGIDFSANTHAAGMTSELLDWYEEGTWTPSDGSGAGLVLTVAAATYVRIGKMVYATFAVTYPSTANGSNARIAGLPFTSQNSPVNMHTVSISFTNSSGLLYGLVDANNTTFSFFANGGVSFSNADLSTYILRGTAIYEVA